MVCGRLRACGNVSVSVEGEIVGNRELPILTESKNQKTLKDSIFFLESSGKAVP
jgi:hypothetical protein